MTKTKFTHLARGGKCFVLKQGVGLFGPQWEEVGAFTATKANLERVKEITRLLNICQRNTDNDTK